MIYWDLMIVCQMLLQRALHLPKVMTFFSVIQSTLEFTQSQTHQFYDKSMYELSFDCRKIYFQHYLNDQHDNLLRRIFIRDVTNNTQIFMYNPDEMNEIVYMYNPDEIHDPIYMYNPDEILGLIDFEVVIPIGFLYNEPLLIQHIDKFRLPGMKYIIVEE